MVNHPLDPYEGIKSERNEWPDDYDPVSEAVRIFDHSKEQKLKELLESNDSIIQRRALAVFGRVGRKGLPLVGAALDLRHHSSDWARFHIMDGIMSYPRELESNQLANVLSLIDDPYELVRSQVVVVIAVLEPSALNEAIKLIPIDENREKNLESFSYYEEIIDKILQDKSQVQRYFDEALQSNIVKAAYIFGALQSISRKSPKNLKELDYSGNDFVAENTCAQMARFIKRSKPIRRER